MPAVSTLAEQPLALSRLVRLTRCRCDHLQVNRPMLTPPATAAVVVCSGFSAVTAPGADAAVLAARAIGGSGGGDTMQPADARCRRLAAVLLRILRCKPIGEPFEGGDFDVG